MKRNDCFEYAMNKIRYLPKKAVLTYLIVSHALQVVGQNHRVLSIKNPFPSSIQFTAPEATESKEYNALSKVSLAQQQSINDIINRGFNSFWIYNFSGDYNRSLLQFAESSGMSIDYMTISGFEGFDRYHPPATSVYSPRYAIEVKERVDSGLAAIKDIKNINAVFPFLDEPFHAGPESFDLSEYARKRFRNIYGYPMPLNVDSVRSNPKRWLDVLNFQSNSFRDGWQQVYQTVKEFSPQAKVVMTHDSHNVFGAGVQSNSRVAIDDVFHWGGNFADIFAYDIYPYMTFDYRYGELGKLPKPRISQMHYTISQLRNLTSTYKKELGFWVGAYCDNWFNRFKGPERKSQYWFEQELAFTAIAHGANYLISTSNYNTVNLPMDTAHWENYSGAMKLVQKAGAGLLEAPKIKSRICFLFPRTQYLQLQEEYFNVGLSFELFLRAFGELDIIHEEQITNDSLNGYKALVLADVKMLPIDVARHIEAFVKKGGVVIADCVPQMDAYKQPLKLMMQLFGVKQATTNRLTQQGQWVPFTTLPPKLSFPPANKITEETTSDLVKGNIFGTTSNFNIISPRKIEKTTATTRLSLSSGSPALLQRQVVKGRVYLLGFCLQDTYFQTWKNNDSIGRKQLQELLSNLLREASINPHIHSTNPDIEASVRASKKEAFVFIINHESREPKTLIHLKDLGFRVGHITDVETGLPVVFKHRNRVIELNIRAPFGTSRLLRIFPVP